MSIAELYCRPKPFRNAFRRFVAHYRLESVCMQELSGDRQLDITADTCPMTFVRTRLALDRMKSGKRCSFGCAGRNRPATCRVPPPNRAMPFWRSAKATTASSELLLRKG
ncbi:sulfurtransferase TusA family protein [Dankookia sp. P2]|uniref:sulfurtransferase TusA family protein n=1 Tax=Dankookia sp. P2 TaxID=3423955 RepID=UPI003D66776F